MANDAVKIAVYQHSLETIMTDLERAHQLCGDVADWVKEHIGKNDDNQEELYRSVRVLQLLEESMSNTHDYLEGCIKTACEGKPPVSG